MLALFSIIKRLSQTRDELSLRNIRTDFIYDKGMGGVTKISPYGFICLYTLLANAYPEDTKTQREILTIRRK